VLGILSSKEGPELVQALLAPADRAWIVPVPGHSSWSRSRLAEAIPPRAAQLLEAADLDQGLRLAGQAAPGQRLIVAGSLYLIGDLLARSHALGDAAPE
jgi:dihydrofolate synthase/folylpolyglutamate synthase